MGFIFCCLMNQQEEISLTAFQKAARALCLWLLADGEKERKAFLRYGKGDTGFYFLKNFSNGYAAAGLPCQMMIERTAVEENHIRGREQRLPCKLSAQKEINSRKVLAADGSVIKITSE